MYASMNKKVREDQTCLEQQGNKEADHLILLKVGVYAVLCNIRDRLSCVCYFEELDNTYHWTNHRWRGCLWVTKRQLDNCRLLDTSSHARL